MIRLGKRNILGVLIDVIDYESAVDVIMEAARRQEALAVSALAVHGVMTGVLDSEHRYRLNHLDLVVPDGQPVRWALNTIHGAGLSDRVYGPVLTLRVCQRAAAEAVPIYLYGSTQRVLEALQRALQKGFPGIRIAGAEPSRFRKLTRSEKNELVDRIQNSGAGMILVGLGCPRQEVWAYEYACLLKMPILAVGAAFDFIAGNLRQAPRWMQDRGLEWLFRLWMEPLRLWRRYLYLNPAYLSLLSLQLIGLYRPNPAGCKPSNELSYG
jgi:N-acetylglucosaminyldiphosphoundecaprenol N-acetyl-beta-D-mannosaminyltransferase